MSCRRFTSATGASISSSATISRASISPKPISISHRPARSAADGTWPFPPSWRAPTGRPSALGSFTLKGRWYVAPERVDLNLEIADTGLDELTTLMRGQAGGIHGAVTSRFHLAGPVNHIGIEGRLNIEDVHRWDLLPSREPRLAARYSRATQSIDAGARSAIELGARRSPAALRALSRLRLPFAAALGGGRQLEPIPVRAADAAGARYGRAASA